MGLCGSLNRHTAREMVRRTWQAGPTESALSAAQDGRRPGRGRPAHQRRALLEAAIEQHLPQAQYRVLKAAEHSEREMLAAWASGDWRAA